jgi:hypothetical protein
MGLQKHSPTDFTVSGWSIWKEGLPQDGPKNDRQFSRRRRMLLRETHFSLCQGALSTDPSHSGRMKNSKGAEGRP